MAVTPSMRRAWILLDRMQTQLGAIHVWKDAPSWPPKGSGSMHANPTSVMALAGMVRVEGVGKRLDLGPGEVLLIAAGVWHRHAPLRSGAVAFGQGFLPAFSDILLKCHDDTWTGRLPSQPGRNLIDAAIADPERCRSAVAAMIDQVLNESVEDLSWGHPAVGRMLRVLWSRLHLGVTTADLVRASGLGQSRAYALFTAAYGVPPREAIATARLWLAESFLASGLGVAETAHRCGYPSPDTFARCWRSRHDAPPSRFRGRAG